MSLSRLAKDLKPYIVPWIAAALNGGSSGGGGGGAVLGAHALDGAYHTGALASSQATQFPLLAGGRTYTGNLVLVDGVLVDGIDISEHAANASAHHAPVTAGDGIDLTGQQVAVDVTDIIDTAYGLTESANNIQISAGAGLTFTAGALVVGAGAGITVNADDVALTTPGSLSVSTTNAAAGNHTHAVTASSDVSAGVASLLKSTAAGGLGLASMFTTGAVDVGQGFTAGNTGFRVIYHTHDYQHTHVVVNPGVAWNLDEQFGLDVDDNLLVRGWIVGKHAIQLDGATMLLHFDGPERIGDLSGQTRGHMGQAPIVETGITFVPGKFGKAVQTPPATTNLVSNPSLETDTTGWSDYSTGSATGTRTRVTDEAYAGKYSYRLVKAGGAATDHWGTIVSVTLPGAGTYTMSAWVYIVAATGNATLQLLGGGVLGGGAVNVVGPTDGWVRVQSTVTAAAGGAASVYLTVANALTMTVYVDAVQVEALAYPTAYCDGSLGTGHSWSGTAHASSSSRTAAVLRYAPAQVLNPRAGTVMAWVYPRATNVHQMVWSHYIAADGYSFVRAADDGTWQYAWSGSLQGSGVAVTANAWTHVCVTWEGTAAKFYVNGVLAHSATVTPWTTLAAYFSVGSYGPSADQHWTGALDDLVFLNRAAAADEVRAVYESNAPVFAETSTWHWRAGRNRIYADAEGLWGLGANKGAILGLYAGDEKDAAAVKSWGGLNLGEGDLLIGRAATGYLHWDDSAETLNVQGNIVITGGSGYANLSDKPTLGTLAAKSSVDLATGEVTNKNLDNVSDGSTYKRVTANEKTGAARGYSGLDASGNLVTKVVPGSNIGTPAGAGLYLGADKMGYYNGGWKTFMNNSGHFAFGGETGARLAWDGTDLFGTDGTTVQWYARASTGKLYAGAGALTLDANGLNLAASGAVAENTSVTWKYSGSTIASLWAYRDFPKIQAGMTVTPYDATGVAELYLTASGNSSQTSLLRLIATGISETASIDLTGDALGGRITFTGDAMRFNGPITAYDASGLVLNDDGGNPGVEIADGGGVTLAGANAFTTGGGQYGIGNPIVQMVAATNTTTNNAGSPRLAMVCLEMDYSSGAGNVSESAAIALSGAGITARDLRGVTVLACEVTYSSTDGSFHFRSTVYAPLALALGGAYQALTAASTAATGTNYTYTTEVKGNSAGTINVKCTRTGGSTATAKIHVSLIVAV